MYNSNRALNRSFVVLDLKGMRNAAIAVAICTTVGIGGFVLVQHWAISFLCVPALFLALGGFFVLLSGCYKADCPVCWKTIEDLSRKHNEGKICPHCRTFVEGRDGQIWAVSEDHVAKQPIYFAPLPEQFIFPDACCVCGGHVTRYDQISEELVHGATLVTMTAATVVKKKIQIKGIPHCHQHRDGAAIKKNETIHFRSYPYLRAFCELNRIDPGPSRQSLTDRMVDVRSLVEFLQSSDADTRKSAAESLGKKGLVAMQAVPVLVQALQDDDERVRKAARATLDRLKPDLEYDLDQGSSSDAIDKPPVNDDVLLAMAGSNPPL